MQIEHLNKETKDGTVRNLDALYQLFPSCFTEAQDVITGKMHRAVDWGKLRELLGEYVESDEPEKYDFTWVGKRAAQREAAAPCRKTLRPCLEESVDWDTTQNLYIEGDNLEVLKLLQNSYMGKVKMIYIDPPYNIGNDFVYHDDFAQSADEYDEHNLDDDGNRFRKNTDSNGRFHSDWCSMIYTRLMVARSLLADDGVIFISMNDCEQRNLKNICDEVFGEANFITQLVWQQRKGGGNDSRFVATDHEYVMVYTKNIFSQNEKWKVSQSEEYQKRYNLIEPNGQRYYWDTLVRNGLQNPIIVRLTSPDGEQITLNSQWSQERVENGLQDGTVKFTKTSNGWSLHHKVYLKGGQVLRSLLTDFGTNKTACDEQVSLFGKMLFDYPKPSTLIRCLGELASKSDSLILDFFSGSASTAHAVMQLNAEDGGNRKFIMVQLPEETAEDSEAYKAGYKNICEIGKERIRRAGKKIKADSPLTTQDLDIGFRVLKCDESNYKPVAFAPKDYTQESLDMFLDNIKEERTGLDLLFDCMMRWGLELSLPYETQKVDGCTIYNVDDGNLVACFDGVVTSAVIDAIADTHPLRVVFRDSSFTEAAQKMNLFELFKQKCGWTDQEVQNNVRVI